jgi:hypothetical protein
MEISNIFPTGVLKHKVSNDIADYIENLITPRLKDLEFKDAVLTDFFKEKIITLEDIQPLVNEIYKCQDYYSKFTNFTPSKGINSFWVQDYNSSHIHGRHNHGRHHYSVVYWVRAKNNPGPLVIYNPNPFTEFWGHSKGMDNLFTQPKIIIPPEKGIIVLFPSYLDHEVLKGGEGCIRTTIAFNLD